MTTSTLAQLNASLDPALASRIVREGYGPGARNIAEIVVHHAFYVRSVIERLGGTPDAFPFAGEDWFPLNDESTMKWSAIATLLESLQSQLAAQVAKPLRNDKTVDEQMDLVLGITCHAVYHAGQIQL